MMLSSAGSKQRTFILRRRRNLLRVTISFFFYTIQIFFATAAAASATHPQLRHRPRQLQDEPSNSQFCGPTWGDAIANCSIETHCQTNDDCAASETCFGYLPGCNINNFESSPTENVGSAAAPSPTPPPINGESDERNRKFCGTSWGDANDLCSLSTWCPEGKECMDGQTCFGGVPNCNAYFLLEIDESGLGGSGGGDGGTVIVEPENVQCSPEVSQCPDGQFVARAPELNCDFYPCPSGPTTQSPSVAPATMSSVTNTFSPVAAAFEDPATPTAAETGSDQIFAPTMKPLWVDNDTDEVSSEGDTSNIGGTDGGSLTNLWCGETRFDATRNCGREGYHCPDGFCLQGGLTCWMISSDCEHSSSSSESSETDNSNSSAVGGGEGTGDVSDTYFCGVSLTDAQSSCHKRCRSGSPGDCPIGETCFLNVYQCTAEIPRPDLTLNSTMLATLAPSTSSAFTEVTTTSTNAAVNGSIEESGLPAMYCANSFEELDASCSTAQSCVSKPCPSGLMCFPYECNSATESDNGATEESGLPAMYCANSFEELDASCSTAQSCVSKPCPSGLMCFPYECNSATESDNGATEESGLPAMYCANSFEELDASCSTAQSCVSKPCPSGLMCFPYECNSATATATESDNGAKEESDLPAMYCANSFEELDASCSTAQSCVSEPCPSGLMCFPYECNAATATQPTAKVTSSPTHIGGDGQQTLPPTTANDKIPVLTSEFFCASSVEELEITCTTTAQRCDGGKECPSDQFCFQYACSATASIAVVENDAPEANPGETFYCASSIAQLNERCGLALPCATSSDCNADGESCVKYTCLQNLMECPLNFVGWHSSKDCKTYYYCEQGVASSTDSCGDGMKFDKTREKCTTDYVDEYCYGLNSYENNDGPVTQPGTAKELCPPGFSGWQSSDGACNEYQMCTSGSPGPTRVCGFGLKFDTTRGECIDEALVKIESCVGPPPEGNLCPSGTFTGWGARNDCTEYFYCEDGKADFINTCASGLLFDIQSGICKAAAEVKCDEKVDEVPQNLTVLNNNVITDSSSNSASGTPPPSPVLDQDFDSGFEWSNTSPPTAANSESKIPPWMFKKDPNGGSERSTNLQVGRLLIIASVYWMLL